jgi:hypothetical protein
MAANPSKKKKRKGQALSRDAAIQRLKTWHTSGESPLTQLHEIFEEQSNTDQFVGDTMFWKYFEDIDVQHVYRHTSVEFKNLKIMFFETIFYFFLLIMLTSYVYELQTRTVFEARQEQLNYWGGCGTDGVCKLDKVRDMGTFWSWMHTEMVPLAFTPEGEYPKVANITSGYARNSFPITWSPRFIGDTMTNLLLGTIRIRQVRVHNNQGCEVSSLFRHIFPDCYGAFDKRWQSTRAYAKRYTPTYIHPCYKFREASETRQVEIEGRMSAYPGDGFMLDLPLNRTESLMMLKDLQQWQWLDQATRMIVVELSVLNTNVNVIVNNQIIFEFGPTGAVQSKHDAFAGRVLLFSLATNEGGELSVMIYQIVVCLLFFTWTVACVWSIKKTMLNYFFYCWNVLDLLILVLFYVNLVLRMRTYIETSTDPAFKEDVVGHPEIFMPFSKVMGNLIVSNRVLCFLCMFCWIKLFKYLCLCGYFRLLVRVLERCAKELVIFSLLLLVIFFGFAIGFFIGMGDSIETYSTVSNSFLVLFFMLLGGFEVDPNWFGPGESQLKPLIFLAYIILVYFILFNVFMAIVLDAYTMVWIVHGAAEAQREQKRNPMLAFLYAWYHQKWYGIALVKDLDDEAVRPEENSIMLTLLPGIVAKKWVEKKRKMQRIIQENCIVDIDNQEQKIGTAEKIKSAARRLSASLIPGSSLELSVGMKSQKRADQLYDIDAKAAQEEISRLQLQRLMDEDETMCLLLGTRRAIDVIRKFKFGDEGSDAVTKLQETVYHKLDTLEKAGLDMNSREVPAVRELSDQMNEAFNEVQNQWRQELTTLLEAASVLSEGLIELTQGMERVQLYHSEIRDKLDTSEGSSDSMTVTSSSGSQ